LYFLYDLPHGELSGLHETTPPFGSPGGGGVFPEGVSRNFQNQKRDILLCTWHVKGLYRAGSRMIDVQVVGGGGGDWMELAQDRDRWRALVSMVKNLRVP
jgi:hypothetical protein